jgi:hypothetical protein
MDRERERERERERNGLEKIVKKYVCRIGRCKCGLE